MQNAVAFSDNDVITIAWSYGRKPDNCMGFAIYRIDNTGKETPLPSHAVFKGNKIKAEQTTAEFPVQKFYWKDPYARLVAKNGNRKFKYKIVPLTGKPGKLKAMTNLPQIISNEIEISPIIDSNLSAYFNRGIISTQRVSRALKGKSLKKTLLEKVADPADALRKSLAGDMIQALTGFVEKAKNSGKIYAALYELGDAELLASLVKIKNKLNIVLSNSVVTDPKTKKKSDGNQDSRDALNNSTKNKWDRMMPTGHIGHNKFLVYVDSNGKPRSVLFGSTNWTSTGLCTQTNNTIILEDDNLAKRYLDYWNQLVKDTKAAKGVSNSLQGTVLRTWDGQGKTLSIPNTSSAQSWFSPNTPKKRSSKKTGEKCPPDMNAVIKCINDAKEAILFLAFYPGTPSLANWSAQALRKNKNLFVRGCVTNKSASQGFYYELKGAIPPKKVKGQKTIIKQDPRVIGAEAFDGKIIPKQWQKEILNAGFAIIHDKILVIDPFSNDCVVITGSHNLGYKASFDNDENLVIIKGNKKLASAYTTHVLDVYDHFSWRWTVKQQGTKGADQSLKSTPAEWLDKYFDENGQIKVAQLKFWLGATGVNS